MVRHEDYESMTESSILKGVLLRIRQVSWFRPIGSSVLRLPGVGGVLRRFIHRVLPRGSRIWFQIPAGPGRGLWLKAEPYLEHTYFSGCPEPCVQEEIVRHLRPAGCFYDGGAHIGYYSLLASRLVGEAGRVVAFEPDPANVDVLRGNLSRNGMSNVEVIPAALWSHCGIVSFQRSASGWPEVSSRRGAVVIPNGKGPDPALIRVEALTLDAFAADHGPPTFIKIDVEGAEVEVLRAAQKLISQVRPVLLLEVHNPAAATILKDRLTQNGYEIEWLAGHPGFAFPRHLLARPG
jgi:FkbM family methyltransferase